MFRCALDLHLEASVTTKAVDFGLSMGMMAECASNSTQMRFRGGAVIKFICLRLHDQCVHRAMTSETTAVFNCVVGLGNVFAVALGAHYSCSGMEIVRVV